MAGPNDKEKKILEEPGAEEGDKGNESQDKGGEGDNKPPAEGGKDSGEVDLSKLDPKVQKIIKDLRTENAGTRSKKKELETKYGGLKKALVDAGIIEDDSEAPEDKIKTLSATASALELNNAILSAAVEHGIAKDDLEFFQFLVTKKMNDLQEDEELTEEGLAEIAAKARKQGGSGAKSTSVGGSADEGKGGAAPAPGGTSDVTLDQFVRMSIVEKSTLYTKQPDVYNRLFADAKQKGLLKI